MREADMTLDQWEALREQTGGLLSATECAELAHWAREAGRCDALEVGHYTGLSTVVLLHGLTDGSRLTTIDHHKGDNYVQASDQKVFLKNVVQALNGNPIMLEVIARDF